MTSTATGDLTTLRAAFMPSAPHVSPFALKLAYLIAFKYMNVKTGTARPSQDTLAARSQRRQVRTVQRMLDILRPLGLVHRPRTRTEPVEHLLDRSR